jgi:hypothetical protein
MFRARPRADARPAARKRTSVMSRTGLAAATVTAAVVTVGVASGAAPEQLAMPAQAGASLGSVEVKQMTQRMTESREQRVSRTADRVRLKPRPVKHKFATEELNVWTQPREKGKKVEVLEWATKVGLTGQSVGHWAEAVIDGKVRWVNADDLAKNKPEPEPEPEPEAGVATTATEPVSSGLSTAPCPDGSSIESGLTAAATGVYRAVCAAFPQPTVWGGYDPHGEHIDGRAIDIMITGEVGTQIAEWLRANASALQIRDIIWAQQIWTPDRAAEGWRYMSDRGSTTANHYDHVHVAVY